MSPEGMSILEEDLLTRRGISGPRNPQNSHELRMPFLNDSMLTPRKRGLLLGNLHLDLITDCHLIITMTNLIPRSDIETRPWIIAAMPYLLNINRH